MRDTIIVTANIVDIMFVSGYMIIVIATYLNIETVQIISSVFILTL